MKNKEVLFNHNSDHWRTPSKLYNYYMGMDYLDPCPYKADFDGLKLRPKGQKIFINPPYSNIAGWVNWALDVLEDNEEILFLIPSRTDTKYFHKLLQYDPEIIFFKGRLKFNDSGSAPFPSVLIKLVPTNKNKHLRRYDVFKGVL